MAEHKTHQTNPRTNYFLSCFGFSGKEKTTTIQTSSSRKTTPLVSLPMFRSSFRKSRVGNTEKTTSDRADSSETHTSKLIKKKPNTTTNHKPSHQNSIARERQTKLRGPDQPNIILGNRNFLDTTRRRAGSSSLPGSPVAEPKPKTQSKLLSHTVSLPALEEGNQRVRVGNPRIHHARINLKEKEELEQRKKKNNNIEVVEKFDPVMGMSIILVTLIIMLVWGRLCAVLCTSAWFYFCPRFRTIVNNDNNIITLLKSTVNSDSLDLNSEEYKKKVVLEGLLERNHRVIL